MEINDIIKVYLNLFLNNFEEIHALRLIKCR